MILFGVGLLSLAGINRKRKEFFICNILRQSQYWLCLFLYSLNLYFGVNINGISARKFQGISTEHFVYESKLSQTLNYVDFFQT